MRNRPTAGNSKFHKRGAPITPPLAPPSALQTAKGAPALKYKRIPFNKRLQKIGGFKEDSVEKVFYKTTQILIVKKRYRSVFLPLRF